MKLFLLDQAKVWHVIVIIVLYEIVLDIVERLHLVDMILGK
jgi:hypothetical protein